MFDVALCAFPALTTTKLEEGPKDTPLTKALKTQVEKGGIVPDIKANFVFKDFIEVTPLHPSNKHFFKKKNRGKMSHLVQISL